jgi:protein O-mannosyl-transferase
VLWWRRGKLEWRREVVPLVPWFVLGAAMGLFSAYVEKKYIGAEGAEFTLTFLQRALLAGRVAWFYFAKLIWPEDLIFIYPRWNVDSAAAWQWVFPIGVVALLIGLWALRHRSRGSLAAVLFFGGSLFPVLGFFNVYAFMFSFVADHWQYLPSIGIVVLAAGALNRLQGRARPPGGPVGVGSGVRGARRFGPAVAAILFVVALGVLTFHQSRMYADMRTFYRTTVARNPQAWMAHNNLGNLLRDDKRLDEAVAHFQAALRVRPDLIKAHNNLANCLRELRRPDEAIDHYRRALTLEPNYVEAHVNLGAVLRERGDVRAALEHLQKALLLDPEHPEARNNFGMTLRDLGRVEDAIHQFQRVVRAVPNHAPAHLNLALTYAMAGREAEAMQHYREARRFNPAIPELPAP